MSSATLERPRIEAVFRQAEEAYRQAVYDLACGREVDDFASVAHLAGKGPETIRADLKLMGERLQAAAELDRLGHDLPQRQAVAQAEFSSASEMYQAAQRRFDAEVERLKREIVQPAEEALTVAQRRQLDLRDQSAAYHRQVAFLHRTANASIEQEMQRASTPAIDMGRRFDNAPSGAEVAGWQAERDSLRDELASIEAAGKPASEADRQRRARLQVRIDGLERQIANELPRPSEQERQRIRSQAIRDTEEIARKRLDPRAMRWSSTPE